VQERALHATRSVTHPPRTGAVFGLLFAASWASAAEPPVLNVYSWADYIAPDTIANFERETGIQVNYDIYDSSEIVDTKLLAGSSGYDVVIHAANYSARLFEVGIMRPLDKTRLPNLRHLDPRVLATFQRYDPGLRYGVPYTHGTTGFTYNVRMIRERMPDAPVDSGDLVFDPEVVSRFADCGVTLLDSSSDVLPMALIHLGYDANSVAPGELHAAEELLLSIRPYVRYFSSQRMLIDLPAEEVCIAMSWSGDYSVARQRAREAGLDVEFAFDMPKEGVAAWFDAAYIPADAPHPDNAHVYLDYLMQPQVIADISNAVGYANANAAATPLVREELRNDPAIYPTAEVMQRMHTPFVLPPKTERLRSRAWSRVKTGTRVPAR
jgi:putrescine transport system substrate-binding protein